MGAGMAPAAFSTIQAHMEDMGRTPNDFDLIVTGDLGQLGKELLLELGKRHHLPLGGKLTDCGTLVFDNTVQDVHAGGSGCGCSAITLCGDLLNKLRDIDTDFVILDGFAPKLGSTAKVYQGKVFGVKLTPVDQTMEVTAYCADAQGGIGRRLGEAVVALQEGDTQAGFARRVYEQAEPLLLDAVMEFCAERE